MPFDDIEQQNNSVGELAGLPQDPGGGAPVGGPPGVGGAPPQAPQAPQSPGGQLGGPGVDTPQEQQAVQLLMQGAQMFRQAASIDPSVRPLIDKALQDAFLQITEHYGFGEEGKTALKQAQLTRNRAQAAKVTGPQGGPPPPPPGSIEY